MTTRYDSFLELVRKRLAMGASLHGIAESPGGDRRSMDDYKRSILEELADQAAYAALAAAKLDDAFAKTRGTLVDPQRMATMIYMTPAILQQADVEACVGRIQELIDDALAMFVAKLIDHTIKQDRTDIKGCILYAMEMGEASSLLNLNEIADRASKDLVATMVRAIKTFAFGDPDWLPPQTEP